MVNIADNLARMRDDIERAAQVAGRSPDSVKLIAVSKTKPEQDVRAAIAAGQMIFGENRVQEAKGKFAKLREENPNIELHLIGPLQTNKAEEAVKLFDVIETLDRPHLAEALAKAIKKTGRTPKFYIEVNAGQEEQKAGIAPGELGSFLNFCRDQCELRIEGLMCIPPQGEDPAPHFNRLKEMAMHHKLPELSMGMSADFETAIRCGATYVRIGTAIFGARNT